MDQELITSLVEELRVSEDLARMAVSEAEGELVAIEDNHQLPHQHYLADHG